MKLDTVLHSSGTPAAGKVGVLLTFLSDESLRIPGGSIAMSDNLVSLFDRYSVPFYSEALSSESVMSERTAFRFVKKGELKAVGRSVLTLFDTWLSLYAPVDASAAFPEDEQGLMQQLFWDFAFMVIREKISYDDWDYERSILVKCMLLPQEHVSRWSMEEFQDGEKFRAKQGWKSLW